MRIAWKIALPVTCAVLIGGAMTFELVRRLQIDRERLAQDAQAYRMRAEKGDAEAEFHLCSMYRIGRGFRKATPRRSGGVVKPPTRTTREHRTASDICTTTDMVWTGISLRRCGGSTLQRIKTSLKQRTKLELHTRLAMAWPPITVRPCAGIDWQPIKATPRQSTTWVLCTPTAAASRRTAWSRESGLPRPPIRDTGPRNRC